MKGFFHCLAALLLILPLTAPEALAQKLPADLGPPTGGVPSQVMLDAGGRFAKEAPRAYDARWFGAVGVGDPHAEPRTANDDTAALQAAYDACVAAGEGGATLKLEAGVYGISTPLTLDGAGEYCRIEGAGRRNTVLVALAEMDVMIDLSDPDPDEFHGRKLITGLSLDGNYLADTLIDASDVRYWTLRENELRRFNDVGLVAANWGVRVTDNEFNGQDASSASSGTCIVVPEGVTVEGESLSRATNGLVVDKNTLSSCAIGVDLQQSPRAVDLWANVFDNNAKAAVWARKGASRLGIIGGYVERAGYDSVAVERGGVTTYRRGAIILSPESNVYAENVTIRDMEFADLGAPQAIVLDRVNGVEIQANTTRDGYTYEHFVSVEGDGIGYTSAAKALIDHAYGPGQFTAGLVGLNAANAEQGHAGLVIRDRGRAMRDQLDASLASVVGNPAAWTADGVGYLYPTSQTYGGEVVWELGASGYVYNELAVPEHEDLSGRYYRVSFLTKGDGASAGGLYFRMFGDLEGDGVLDDVLFEHAKTDTGTLGEWVRSNHPTFYVPTGITKLRFDLRPASGASVAHVARFVLARASEEHGAAPSLLSLPWVKTISAASAEVWNGTATVSTALRLSGHGRAYRLQGSVYLDVSAAAKVRVNGLPTPELISTGVWGLMTDEPREWSAWLNNAGQLYLSSDRSDYDTAWPVGPYELAVDVGWVH
jgi:hypothetical protein